MGITGEQRGPGGYHHRMDPEQPRPVASGGEHEYSLTIEEVADRYAAAGHPRTIRAIQKYCARGDLECQKAETVFGQRYLVTAASVARHISQIEELRQTNVREQPRLAANVRPSQDENTNTKQPDANVREQPRPAANEERYVARLEGEIDFLRDQVQTKDAQIKELTERSRETNVLFGGLQRMLTPLLGGPSDRDNPDHSSANRG
jgi:hypothetical protein